MKMIIKKLKCAKCENRTPMLFCNIEDGKSYCDNCHAYIDPDSMANKLKWLKEEGFTPMGTPNYTMGFSYNYENFSPGKGLYKTGFYFNIGILPDINIEHMKKTLNTFLSFAQDRYDFDKDPDRWEDYI